MLGMMENRVLTSYSTIGVPGVRTAAKTGTARMGRSNLVMSIVGVAPANDPQVLVYTVFFKRGSQVGADISTAGPSTATSSDWPSSATASCRAARRRGLHPAAAHQGRKGHQTVLGLR